MNAPADNLEVLVHRPTGGLCRPSPLLFVHGAYVGAWVWEEHVLPWFAERGWEAWALSLSGHGASRGHAHLDALSIADYVDDVREVAAGIGRPPVLIGHSMGGMVVQKFLEHEPAPGIVLMASVPPAGLFQSALTLMFRSPGLLMDLNRIIGGGHPHLESLRKAMFHQPMVEQKLRSYYLRMQPESMRALWDMTAFALPRKVAMHHTPALVLGAQCDNLIPVSQVEQTARFFNTEAHVFADMGHGMMLERDWEAPARCIEQWLLAQNL